MGSSSRRNEVRASILEASKSLLWSLSTSLGPKGQDKMIIKNKKTVITNDGATILKYMTRHPVYRILSNLSAAQDEECGDGTTSVVVLTVSMLENIGALLEKGVRFSTVYEGAENAKKIALEYIGRVKIQSEKADLMSNVATALSSKVVSSSVEVATAAIKSMEYAKGDKNKIRIVKRVGGVLDDTRVYEGILLVSDIQSPPRKVKIAVIQFCLSAPKTNMDNKVLIKDSAAMERMVQEERRYVADLCKKIKESGCTLLLIQKSILRDSLCDSARNFLRQMGILVVNSVERKDVCYVCEAIGIKPVSDVDLLNASFLAEVEVEETEGMLQIKGYGCTILVRGCDEIIGDEVERCLNDAISVVKCLNDDPFLVPGGGSIEMGISSALEESTEGNAYVLREFAKAFECIPCYLSKNAGLSPVEVMSDLKKELKFNSRAGISVRSGRVGDMVADDFVVQPAKVSENIAVLSLETALMMLKIDDILPVRR